MNLAVDFGEAQAVEVSAAWIVGQASAVSNGTAYGLLHGYPGSGFFEVLEGELVLGLSPFSRKMAFDPAFYWDLRLFGPKGEWHCWNTGDWWMGRLVLLGQGPAADLRSRRFALWGRKAETTDGWHVHSEQRGTVVRVPASWEAASPKDGDSVLLEIWERIDHEPETGLAGVTDALVRGFKTSAQEDKP